MPSFDMIAFDADDTLWYFERLFVEAHAKIIKLLNPFGSPEEVEAHLNNVELRNIPLYGYGIKSYALSMIEAATEIDNGQLSSREVRSIIRYAKEMLEAQIQLIEHVPETIAALSKNYRLAIITKGDLFEQQKKIARSGLESFFRHVEILSQKTADNFSRFLAKQNLSPEHFLMVGDSLRSDILPVLELGGHAVYIPGDTTWTHEAADPPSAGTSGFYELNNIGELPAYLEQISLESS